MNEIETPTALAPADDPRDRAEAGLLSRMLDYAHSLDAYTRLTDISVLTTAEGEAGLAMAYLIAIDRWIAAADRRRVPELAKCGWCHHAGGDTEESWNQLPAMTRAESRDHALTCQHNPLVKALELAHHTIPRESQRVVDAARAFRQGLDHQRGTLPAGLCDLIAAVDALDKPTAEPTTTPTSARGRR